MLDTADNIDRRRIENVLRSTADVCGVEYHEMAWLGFKEDGDGMIAVMVLIPSKCLATLQFKLDRDNDRTLEEIGIVSVVVVVGAKMKPRFGKRIGMLGVGAELQFLTVLCI